MNRQAMRYAGTIISGISLVALVYFSAVSYIVASNVPFDTIEAPALEAVTTEAHLRAAPPPSNESYDGLGNPIVVIRHAHAGGGLDGVLHHAEAWTEDAGGVDVCGRAQFLFDDFRVFEPTGGAAPNDGDVTYASETYEQPVSTIPGGDECAARFSPGKIWHYRVCWEFDGILSPPAPSRTGTRFDDWDGCVWGTTETSSLMAAILGS